MTMISGGGAPSFKIGVAGDNFVKFSNDIEPSWGDALSKIGGAWAKRHRKEQAEAAGRAKTEQQAVKRGEWMQAVSQGATLRDLATSDPSLLSDTGFIKFVQGTKAPVGFTNILDDEGRAIGQRGPDGRAYAHPLAPEPEQPEAETWDVVQSPFGRGGSAQQSSVSGKFSGYLAPRAPQEPAPQRERKTAKDRHGRLRYLDDQSAAFSDETLGAAPEKEKAKFEHVRALAGDWESATKPVRALSRQRDLMQIGLEAARRGDMAAGSQAVLVTFQKILDPSSVVRESEYARSSSGLSMLERMRGAAEKLAKGGAGVSIGELEAFARLADEAVSQFGKGWLTQERDRIGTFADAYNIPRKYVFQGGRFAPKGPPQKPRAPAPPGMPQGLPQQHPQAAPPGMPQAQAPSPRAPAPQDAAAARGVPQVTGMPPLGLSQQGLSPQAPGPDALTSLARALGGASPTPPGQAQGPAPQGAGVMSDGDTGDDPRVAMYAVMGRTDPDALKRQVADMAKKLTANPKAYSQAEVDAAKRAFDAAFPGER